MRLITSVVFFLHLASSVSADVIPPPARKTTGCGTTFDCEKFFGSQESYIPTPSTPIKTVAINFNIMQKSDGSGNWKNTEKDLAALRLQADWMNGLLAAIDCEPTDPCPGVTYPRDSRIRISLENTYFYQSDILWSSWNNASALLDAVFAAHPEARNQLNVFFVGGPATGPKPAPYAWLPHSDHNMDHAVVMPNYGDSDGLGNLLNYAASGTLAHEAAHVFGLLHLYPDSGGNCCQEESQQENPCDYLSDAFCPPTNPYLQEGGWNCDPASPTRTCTNNIMAGVQTGCLFTALQLGRMHRALSIMSPQKYVKPPACLRAALDEVLYVPLNERYGRVAGNIHGSGGSHVDVVPKTDKYAPGPSVSAGKVSRALCFNGTSQYVDVPSYAAVNFGTVNFSIEAWVKRDVNDTGVRVIAEKRTVSSAGYHGYSFFLYDGRPALQLADGGYANFIAASAVPTTGGWHHVAVTVQRLSGTGGTFYIDGIALATKFDPRPRRLSLDNTAPFRIGATTHKATATSFFSGCIDEVAAYARVLTTAEVQAIFNAQAAGRCLRHCTASSVTVSPAMTTATLAGRLCNATILPQMYLYWFEPRFCGGVEPSPFSTCSSTVLVPASSCVTITSTTARPQAFDGTGKVACYRIAVQSLGNDDVTNFTCDGALLDPSPIPH